MAKRKAKEEKRRREREEPGTENDQVAVQVMMTTALTTLNLIHLSTTPQIITVLQTTLITAHTVVRITHLTVAMAEADEIKTGKAGHRQKLKSKNTGVSSTA